MHQLRSTNLAAAVLDPLLRADPSKPRITYYDIVSGERVELSTATFANWAAKTGNLLRDELGAGPDSRVAVLLPAHWQTAAVVFGIWWIGAEVLFLPAYSPDLNPIEKMWSKLKEFLRSAEARSRPSLIEAIASALETITAQDVINWLASCGFRFI